MNKYRTTETTVYCCRYHIIFCPKYRRKVLRRGSQNFREAARPVETVRLDDFVSENNIPRVDFIKADIQGFERNMLEGAQETLARFAPKLAICTYHLPDDPEVLAGLIKIPRG